MNVQSEIFATLYYAYRCTSAIKNSSLLLMLRSEIW
ncbi:hypothetical protein IAD21_01829 [Abditibacteriota bacterium]|nr:hypothetical protein IAD21_01829 [Abditibacteriota bacterium]